MHKYVKRAFSTSPDFARRLYSVNRFFTFKHLKLQWLGFFIDTIVKYNVVRRNNTIQVMNE